MSCTYIALYICKIQADDPKRKKKERKEIETGKQTTGTKSTVMIKNEESKLTKNKYEV
jgi:hypothetical protein